MVGCTIEAPSETVFRDSSSCTGGAGLVGLDSVTVTGGAQISGADGGVFSNGDVTIVGNASVGTAIAGGSVDVNGGASVGTIVEGADPITVEDPTALVEAASLDNDNDQVPCIQKGNKCVSPLDGFDLSLNSRQALILPAGEYYFESIAVNGQASLGTDGDVTIFLNGPATFNGGSATDSQGDSLVIVSAADDQIKINGGSEAKMRIFAPFAPIKFAGTTGFSGSAIGLTINIHGNADLTVDDGLDGYVGCEEGDSTGEDSSGEGSSGEGPEEDPTDPTSPDEDLPDPDDLPG